MKNYIYQVRYYKENTYNTIELKSAENATNLFLELNSNENITCLKLERVVFIKEIKTH